jgi:hypothetical protein
MIVSAKGGAEANADLSESSLAAALGIDAIGKAEADLTAQRQAAINASTWRAEAERGITQALLGQSAAREASSEAAAAYARVLGDEAGALTASADATAERATAKQLEAQAAAQSVEAAKRDLEALVAVGKEKSKEAEQIRALIPQLTQKAIATQQAADATQADVLAAQLASATYGDQSEQLVGLIQIRDRLTKAIRQAGEASAAAAPLEQALAVIQVQIADAATDAAKALDLQIAANERALTIDQARLALQTDETNRLMTLAQARGDDARAAQYARDIMRDEAAALTLASDAKERDAALLTERARLMQIAAEATGGYTAEERAQVDAMRDAATMAEIESDRMAIAARTKREAAQAGAELAATNRRLAESFDAAGLAGVRSMDDVSSAISRAATGPELEALAAGLEAALAAGVGEAAKLSDALAEVEQRMKALKGQPTRVAGLDFEDVFRQYGEDSTRAAAGLFRGPTGDRQAQQFLADYNVWLREQGAFGGQSTPGQPQTAQDFYAARQQRQEAQAEAASAAASATAAAPTQTIRFEFPGRPAATGTFAPADAKSLLAGMEQLKGTT